MRDTGNNTSRMQNKENEEINRIIQSETVDVSVKFAKELDERKVEEFEKYWLKFKRLPNGDIAKSGPIYGARIAWEKICHFAELEEVVRMESIWKPTMAYPSGNNPDQSEKGGVR